MRKLTWIARGPVGLALFVAALAAGRARAAEIDMSQYKVRDGFELEVFAIEPIVMDPAEMVWDENGLIYVVEMAGYPIAPSSVRPFPGRIAVIEDTDGDGKCDKRTIFADDLQYADSILPYRGGLFVADPPRLMYMKDTDGDRKADVRETVLEGFAVGNAQHNYGGLCWGLDGWVYGASGGNDGTVRKPGEREPSISIGGLDFRFNPDPEARKRELSSWFEIVGQSAGGFGIALDDWGHYFTTHNTAHFQHMVFPQRYLDRNKYMNESGTTIQAATYSEGGLARVFPIGEPETRVNHPEQSGYFSGACGITHYGGGAFGEEFNGSIFVADVVTHLVHRVVVREEGPLLMGYRGAGEERSEFFASSDPNCRPVNLETGPDGALYIVDFYRAVIEHPEWIPDEIEKNLDVRAGEDKGRIFRVTPKGGLPRVTPKYGSAATEELVAALEHPNKWHRETAQRLLIERHQDEQEPSPLSGLLDRFPYKGPEGAAWPPLRTLLNTSKSPVGRLHAMRTLAAIGGLEEKDVISGLRDEAPGVRENALQIADAAVRWALDDPGTTKLPREMGRDLKKALFPLLQDPNARVRMQAALTLGELEAGADPPESLLKLLERDHESDWTRKAILCGLGERPLPMFQGGIMRLEEDADALGDGGKDFLKELACIIGARAEEKELLAALDSAQESQVSPSAVAPWILDGLAKGVGRADQGKLAEESRKKLAASVMPLIDEKNDAGIVRAAWSIANALGIPPGEKQQAMLRQAAEIAADASKPEEERRARLELLAFADFGERKELLFSLLDPSQPTGLQAEAMAQLRGGPNGEVAPRIIAMWKQLGPAVLHDASNILLYRKENHDALLGALENKDIAIGQMRFDLERRRALLRSMDKSVRTRAQALFTDAGVVTRAEAIEKMRPALALKGDAALGHTIWKDRCSKCHVIGGEGSEVGSNLTDIFRKSGETLLHDIIDPNAAVDARKMSYTVVTKKGETLNGIVAAESAGSVTLREGEAKETTIPRESIKEMHTNGLSLMPEELESDMSHQDMANLLAFLQQPR